MRKTLLLRSMLSVMLFVLLINACSKTNIIHDSDVIALNDGKNTVSSNLVERFISKSSILTKGSPLIEPVLVNRDTVLFLANMGNKWMIFSGDTRYYPILAFGEGEKHLSSMNETEKLWLDAEAEIVYRLRHNDNQDTMYQCFRDFWDCLDKPSKLNTKADEDDQMHGEHWELDRIEQYDAGVDEMSHIVSTLWHQNHPWNLCCPTISTTSTDRAKSGCTAVAGAQMLYHYYTSRSLAPPFYTFGQCNGTLGEEISFSFSNPSETAWENMAKTQIDIEGDFYQTSILIAYVAEQIGTTFGENSSSASLQNLETFLDGRGFNSTIYNFNISSAISHVKANKPVILSADGHCWLADGYYRATQRYDYIYKWTSRTDDRYEYGQEMIRSVYVNADYLQMNWGWGSVDNAFYSSENSWEYNGNGPYTVNRKMILY